ncbi:hypothetical protein XA68_11884 [Ophiocordyceps unilateralis]|uniref:Uncharacterized protein n=1 Tax=Ophiocordyceps unilateralis TaxID=268505 RepID=A0A2A9P211_OPHUN|nr:hypothetical protein XA68_11884 [Ophiocordyceps unilateralis]
MTDVAYKERSAFSGPSSGEPQTPHHSKQAMLTVDFSTPAAAAPPRADRLKQMTANHPAFDRSRLTQEILVRVQHALRRMPGVSGQDANELVTSLQEVGQIVNQETTQLVDALMNLSLDQEDSEQAMARMSLEANLAQAQNKDQAQLIHKLRTEARAEQEKRGEAEAAARTALDKVDALAEELKRVKESVNKTADDLVQVGESASRPGSPRRQQDRRVTPSWGPVECRQVVRREPMAADSTTTPIRESEMAFVREEDPLRLELRLP